MRKNSPGKGGKGAASPARRSVRRKGVRTDDTLGPQ
jgi:hypothetical protein